MTPERGVSSAEERWRAWSQEVLGAAMEMIAADANTILVSAKVDFQPDHVRIVYRSRWWPRALGFRGHVPLPSVPLGSAAAISSARLEFAEYLSRFSVCEPLGNYAGLLTTDGGIEWWGDGYPTLALAPNVSPLLADSRSEAEADDDDAWQRWRSRGLIPQTDTAPARWLAEAAGDGFPARAVVHAYEEPDQGFDFLSDGVLEQVSAVLARHTDTPEGNPKPPKNIRAYPSMVTSGPRAEMAISTEFGSREYVLFSGPVSAAPAMGFDLSDASLMRTWPNIIWPTDNAWLAEHGIDDAAVTVSGTAALLEALSAIAGIRLERAL